ncbi:MAG: ABC transporter permease [Caldilinea sp.]
MTVRTGSPVAASRKAAQTHRVDTPWRRSLRRFGRHKAAVLAFVFLLFLLLCALAPGLIAPYDPLAIDMTLRLQPPSLAHLFGTDDFGRDILSRLIYGARISLQVGLVSVAISATFGVLVGILAGYFGGYLDAMLMLIMDVLFAFPAILLAITIMAILGASTVNVMIAVGIVYIPVFARVVRGVTLELRVQDYVDAARSVGTPPASLLWRHILPGTLGALTVQITLSLAFAILAEAALSFLGLGTQPPEPSWGSMLSFGREWIREAPWFSFFPGFAIFITVLCLNLVGDGWRDALDPRL